MPRSDPVVAATEIAAFRAFVTACFSRRRKQLRNAVMAATGASRPQVSALLERVGLDPMRRPETLAPEEFAGLLRASREL
jgi:16S rRNA A1518/A1519 N6-dimethyltransferase RsmA/KsgA/DIM1 with predicted DNA glycosylase/AP lyase activity